MQRAIRAGLLLLLLASCAGARPLEIRFSTLPPDCTVTSLDRPKLPHGIGHIQLEPPASGDLKFRLLKSGYHSLEVTIPRSALGKSDSLDWPPQAGSFLRLEPLLVTANILTSPPGAQIWTSRSGQGDDYLGMSGQPLLLNLAELLAGSKDGFFRIRLTAPGYQSVVIPVPEHLFGPGRPNHWPAEGEYALAPTEGFLAPLVFYFRLKPWISGMIMLTLLSLAAVLLRLASKAWRTVRLAQGIEQRRAASDTELSGSRLGPYRLFDVLGKGATATVFRGAPAEGSQGQANLAVKVFHLSSDPAGRLASEVRPLLELRHPNLVSLFDWGQADGFTYLVTELVPGRTLRQFLEHGCLPLEAWKSLVDDLLRGLAFAHERGVIHGDIKPENILLPFHGKAKLVDFGLARQAMRPGIEHFGGTPGYMAPELLEQRRPTPASDQFAAGTLLFEALYESFPGPSPPERYPELWPMLARMRDPDPAKRFDDIEEARQALLSVRLSR